jgi:hypothetical protein
MDGVTECVGLFITYSKHAGLMFSCIYIELGIMPLSPHLHISHGYAL